MSKITPKLNVNLNEADLTKVIGNIKEQTQKIDPVGKAALVSDYCCVDASVASSVAGPASSVASSVSTPDPTQIASKVNAIKGVR